MDTLMDEDLSDGQRALIKELLGVRDMHLGPWNLIAAMRIPKEDLPRIIIQMELDKDSEDLKEYLPGFRKMTGRSMMAAGFRVAFTARLGYGI